MQISPSPVYSTSSSHHFSSFTLPPTDHILHFFSFPESHSKVLFLLEWDWLSKISLLLCLSRSSLQEKHKKNANWRLQPTWNTEEWALVVSEAEGWHDWLTWSQNFFGCRTERDGVVTLMSLFAVNLLTPAAQSWLSSCSINLHSDIKFQPSVRPTVKEITHGLFYITVIRWAVLYASINLTQRSLVLRFIMQSYGVH